MVKIYKNFISRINNSDFAKNTLVVVSGTAIAQIFPILFIPVLARIYSPSEFGLLAVIASLVPIISVISSGAYEGGILISKSKQASANLAVYILIRSLIVLLIFLSIIIIFNSEILKIFNEPLLKNWLYLVPVISLGVIFFNISNEWFVKYKYFSKLSLNKAFYTISNVLSKLFIGLSSLLNSGGLILGDLVGKFFISSYASYVLFNLEGKYFKAVTGSGLRNAPKEIPDFPKYMMPDQIISNLGGSIHVFFISAYFGSTELGFVAIVSSILYVPITVFSAAIKDVFRQRAIEDFQQSGSCRNLYLKLLLPVSLMAVFGFSILYLIIPTFFNIFLGEQWTTAGAYAQIMTPLFCLSFISMALKDVFVVVKKMHIALYWQIFFILLLLLSLIISTSFFQSIEATLYAMTLANCISYLVYIILSYIYAKA